MSATVAYSAIGQTFKTPNNGQFYRLTSTTFYLIREMSVGYLISELYNMTGSYGTTGKPTGNALAVSDIVDVATIPSSGWTLISFTFSASQQFIMTPNTAYAIVVRAASNGFSASLRIDVGIDSIGATGAGNMFDFSSMTWNSWATSDACFYVYGLASPRFTFRTNNGGNIVFNGAQVANGSVTGVYSTTTYTIAATPLNQSYRFLNFTYGASNSTSNPLVLSTSSDVIIWAYFGSTPTATPYVLARFSWSPANPTINEAVSFDGTLSNSSSEITSYVWAFGDGNTGTGSTAVHSYTASGAKTVTLTVTSSVGSDAFSAYVVVSSGLSAEEGSSAGSHVFAPTPNALPWFVGQIVTGAGAIALLDYLNKKIRKIGPQKVKKRIHTVIKKVFTRREWDHVEN